MDRRTVALILLLAGCLAARPFSISYEVQRDYFVAVYFFQQGEEKAGEKLLNKLLRENPNLFDIYIRFYELSLKHKKWDDALEWLKRAKSVPVEKRVIIDSDLLSFRIDQAVKDVQEKKAEIRKKKEEKKKSRKAKKTAEKKRWRTIATPYLVLEKGKVKVYRGKQDKLKKESVVAIEYRGDVFPCTVEVLRILSLTLSCQNLPEEMPKKGNLVLRVKRLRAPKKQ